MKNSNLLSRIITCFIGIPLLAAVILLVPQYNFIGLRILVTVAALLGSLEMSRMLFSKITLLSLISWILPLLCFFNNDYADYYLAALVIVALTMEIKKGETDDFEQSISRIGKNLLVVIYPSYLLTFTVKFTALHAVNVYIICYYILLVFSNDIFAYVFGMLFGKSNNAGLKASPKKSYAGFIGGFVSCIAVSLIFTTIFRTSSVLFESAMFRFVCPMGISILADIGDLAESVIKRSAKVKDSSHLIPGHGGVLDRLDSIVATAPFFYIIIRETI